MKAEVVSVGTELLLGQTVDTNATQAGKLFASLGIDHYHRQTVGDNLARLTETLKLALSRADIVLTIGGLGPTQDDLTRDGVAAVLESPLVEDPALRDHLVELMRSRGIKMVESQYRQATRPQCAEPLSNPNGTAPGLVARKDGKTVFCLPGPPNEFNPMLEGPVKDALLKLGDGTILFSRTLRIVGIGEAALEEQMSDLLIDPEVTLAPYAKVGEVHLRLTTRAKSTEEGESKVKPMADEIYRRIPEFVYAEGEDSLPALLIKLLTERSQTVSVAESCTGGLLGAAFTSINGSSAAFRGGFLTYTADLKRDLAGVAQSTLNAHGTVSEPTAAEMATGTRFRLKTDYAISITGVAGLDPLQEPDGEKPSGLVYIGIAGPNGVTVNRYTFTAGGKTSRDTIRQRAVAWALASFRNVLVSDSR